MAAIDADGFIYVRKAGWMPAGTGHYSLHGLTRRKCRRHDDAHSSIHEIFIDIGVKNAECG